MQHHPRPRLQADRAADQHVAAERRRPRRSPPACCARRPRASPPVRWQVPRRATPTASSSGRTSASARTAHRPASPRRHRPSPRSSARRAGRRRAPTSRCTGSAASTRRAARRARRRAGAPASARLTRAASSSKGKRICCSRNDATQPPWQAQIAGGRFWLMPQHVLRVVDPLDRAEPVVVGAVGGAHAVRALVHHEVHVRPARRVRVLRRPSSRRSSGRSPRRCADPGRSRRSPRTR